MKGREGGENTEIACSSPHHNRQNHKALVQCFLVGVSWVGEGAEGSHMGGVCVCVRVCVCNKNQVWL